MQFVPGRQGESGLVLYCAVFVESNRVQLGRDVKARAGCFLGKTPRHLSYKHANDGDESNSHDSDALVTMDALEGCLNTESSLTGQVGGARSIKPNG